MSVLNAAKRDGGAPLAPGRRCRVLQTAGPDNTLVPVPFGEVFKASLRPASVVALAANCPQLERVNLANCELITAASVVALAANCPRLVFVVLIGCELITAVSVDALTAALPDGSVIE